MGISNYRVIRSIRQLAMDRFHVLVGPNASGKTTFLDAIDFVSDCLRLGPMSAVERRVPNYRDLTYERRGGPIEFDFLLDCAQLGLSAAPDRLNYRLVLVEDERLGVRVKEEALYRHPAENLRKKTRLLGKTKGSSDYYRREDGTYQDSFTFGLDKLTLAMTPADEKRYPTASALRSFLTKGVRYIQLNSRAMRQPCPATRPTDLELDGTNLARVVGRLRGKSRTKMRRDSASTAKIVKRWTGHLRHAIEDLSEIGWSRREPDNAEYIVLKYDDGFECPSWLVSDGTLRMLALTLLAFLPPEPGIYMVEEPENGVHPKALEIIVRSLSAIPGAQVLVATHSPMVVQQVGRDALLCFSRGKNGAQIAHGTFHNRLRDWNGMPDLATIHASGILG
jgi:predicted ATPase